MADSIIVIMAHTLRTYKLNLVYILEHELPWGRGRRFSYNIG